MRDIAQVFQTLWKRAGEFNSVPILTPKLIPLGDYGRITNRNGDSGDCRLPASREPISSIHSAREKRTFGAAAECSRLAACAPQIRVFGRGNGIIAMSTSAGQRG